MNSNFLLLTTICTIICMLNMSNAFRITVSPELRGRETYAITVQCRHWCIHYEKFKNKHVGTDNTHHRSKTFSDTTCKNQYKEGEDIFYNNIYHIGITKVEEDGSGTVGIFFLIILDFFFVFFGFLFILKSFRIFQDFLNFIKYFGIF